MSRPDPDFGTDLGALAIAAFILWLGTGCNPEPVAPELAPSPACNELTTTSAGRPGEDSVQGVVLVLNDTMRRDAASLYGGSAHTPALDEFGAVHLVFERAVSQAPWTKPSIATLFTSLQPSQHRVESHPQLGPRVKAGTGPPVEADVLAESLDTLAETLQAAGFRTAAFVANPWLVKPFGFDQGFEVYDASFARWGVGGEAVVEAGLAWLDSLAEGERFFLYLHTIDSHRPYGRIAVDDLDRTRTRFNGGRPLPGRHDRMFASRIRLEDGRRASDVGFEPTDLLVREAYRRGVERFDAIFAQLVEALEARTDVWPKTALIFTSDHGEALYERGWGNHGGALYEEDVLVPLVARLPGVSPESASVSCPVGLVDIMPTLCDYLGAPCPASVRGVSFLATAEGTNARDPRYLISEGVMHREGDRALRTDRYKLVRSVGSTNEADVQPYGYALYDLESDPRERFNRLSPRARTPESERIFEFLLPALEDAVEVLPAPAHGTAPLDEDVRRQLEALGYGESTQDR